MSNKTELQSNNIELQEILDSVNALPDAGNGGGSVETCTVTINSPQLEDVAYSKLKDGRIELFNDSVTGSTRLEVVKNTLMRYERANSLEVKYEGAVFQAGIEVVFVIGDGTITHNPCFARNTPILLADGTTKLVQDITYKDKLLVWDFDNGCYSTANPVWIKKSQTTDYYYLCKFANGAELKLIGSEGKCHRLLDIEKGSFESATDCVGKQVMSNEGETTLLSCERVDEEVEFYNIITDKHLNLFAEGMLTSCRLNNLYPIKDMKFVKDNRVLRTPTDYPNIDANMFAGLRLAEQLMDIEEANEYVARLYNLMEKPNE